MRTQSILTALVVLTATSTVASAAPPMKPWGKPSLQGTWDFKNATPLSRPERWKDKEFLTPEEAAEIQQGTIERRAAAAARVKCAMASTASVMWMWATTPVFWSWRLSSMAAFAPR